MRINWTWTWTWTWEILRNLWAKGPMGQITALSLVLIILVTVAEAAQSNLFGETAFRFAARIVPWQPIFLQRAALTATISIKRPDSEIEVALVEQSVCPVNSVIYFKIKRNRSGWVSAFALTEKAEHNITNKEFISEEIVGKDAYPYEYKVRSADGVERLVIVGADKQFNPKDEIIPAIRKLTFQGSKGGGPLLDGYNIDWSDKPILMTCISS